MSSATQASPAALAAQRAAAEANYRQPIYLRCELKPQEHRAALTPTTAKVLLDAGFDVTVERDPERIFDDDEYERVGCKLSPHNTWGEQPSHVPIIGLKELPTPGPDLPHTHIQFAHCFKRQAGWQSVLARFRRGGGRLYDLEFLDDARGRRVAAFGWHAGFAGAALGVLAVAEQLRGDGQSRLGAQKPYPNERELVAACADAVKLVRSKRADGRLRALVVGALGRCGRGAIDFFEKAGVESEDIVRWDIQETSAKPGPYKEMLDVDIFVNCIYLDKRIPPFLTRDFVRDVGGAGRRLGCVVDVSCDTTNPNNPIPIYTENSTFDRPTLEVDVGPSNPRLTVISIDHLPTLLPREASEGFSHDLLPSLLELPYVLPGHPASRLAGAGEEEGKGAVWTRAERLFRRHLAEAESEVEA